MFSDEPRFVLPWHDREQITISWDTRGPLAGPFLMPVESQPVGAYARKWLNKQLDKLEDYLPFDFKVKKDNRPADIRLSVVGEIQLEGLELGPNEYVSGLIIPNEGYHGLALRFAPYTQQQRHTALHELGHAFGLTHPGEGGADPNYTTADTIMSYNVTNPSPWFRPADLQRLQEIWGHDRKDIDPITGIRYNELPS